MPDDDRVRITAQPDGTALVWLPYVDYLDTQAGPVEVGLDEDVARQLWLALGRHLASSESEEFEVVGDWGVDGAEDADDARAQVAKWLAAHPHSGAHAQRRTVLTFEDDDAQYVGGWQPLACPAGVSRPNHPTERSTTVTDDLSRFDRDPDALAWARQKIQHAIDQCADFERQTRESGALDRSMQWRSKKNFMQTKFIGGQGCVIAAFDERLPDFRKLTDGTEAR